MNYVYHCTNVNCKCRRESDNPNLSAPCGRCKSPMVITSVHGFKEVAEKPAPKDGTVSGKPKKRKRVVADPLAL